MDISNLSIATIRSLGIDTINKANSGHPGMVLGSAPALYTLFNKELNIYNKEEKKVYGIRDGIKLMTPYLIALSVAWIAIILLWYLVGLPLGPGVYPAL